MSEIIGTMNGGVYLRLIYKRLKSLNTYTWFLVYVFELGKIINILINFF